MKNVFLRYPTKPMDVSKKSISQLTNEMILTGFQGRKLGEVVETWLAALERNETTIFFGLAGAMIPAGMRKIMAYLISKRMIDVLVSTGANLYHDCHEALGRKHYLGSYKVDDVLLHKNKVDRIYDVFANEKGFYKTDIWIEKFSTILEDGYPYSSREILYLLGEELSKRKRSKNSILVSAYNAGVPIFCPAIADSSLGFSIMFANIRRGKKIIVNTLADIEESSQLCEKSKNTAGIYVGGGVPKNFIQQTAVIASYYTRKDKSHGFGIQITTDLPQWGGLSGCTLEESQSWGKYKSDAGMVTCNCDATIALPIVAHALMERGEDTADKRDKPIFTWNGHRLKLKYGK
jgi:deoxyhypusine synthase